MRRYLIGLPGCGKSYWASELVKNEQHELIDLDLAIEKHYQKSISEIFEQEGQEVFRKIENNLLKKISEEHSDFIMACGGGTPCFHNNMDIMLSHGEVVYLEASPELITKRIEAKSQEVEKRPLFNTSRISLQEKIQQLLSARKNFYKKADHTINVDRPFNEVLLDLKKVFQIKN